MNRSISAKGLTLLTFLNLSIFNALGYHGNEQASGSAISIPSYSDPVNFLIYFALPGALIFFAVQQPIERKLEGKWRRDEPARKYSTIIAGLTVAIAVISPVFHSFPGLEPSIFAGVLGFLAAVGLVSYKWEEVREKLPL